MTDERHNPNAWATIKDEPKAGVVCVALAPLLNRARTTRVSTLRFGEKVHIHALDRNWILVSGDHDNYLGWTNRAQIKELPISKNRSRVTEKFTISFSEPDIKSKAMTTLPMGAWIDVDKTYKKFHELANIDGHVWIAHTLPKTKEPFEWAKECLGAPYLWGGGSPDGIDCSGLTQLAFSMAGYHIPRDSDQQEQALPAIKKSELKANDLVFWKGHVGMMINDKEMVHSTAFAMQCIIEPLEETIARVGEPSSFRRKGLDI